MNFFKYSILTLFIAFSCNFLGAQDEFTYKVDQNIFTKNSAGMYMSEDEMATLGIMKIPIDFESLAQEIKNDSSLGENVEKGFLENGKLLFIQEVEFRNDIEYLILAFIKKGDSENSINIISGFPLSQKEMYYPLVLQTAKSAKIKQE